ncbi:uncharacterized protein LOC108608310 [Drosophila busckii]|uniref:uncharacterized protein LOC108608310 n=1 Tax=Drosophila busckii TaxID=30019 RepID=UPI00083EDF5A|nr:uncharacterized protein LOC108608310 [Drosophila busckii]
MQSILIAICLGAILVTAQEPPVEQSSMLVPPVPGLISGAQIFQIVSLLESNGRSLNSLERRSDSISQSQKGIEVKLQLIGQDVVGISRVEEALKRLDLATASNFRSTASDIRNVTASIKEAETRTDRSIGNLARGQQEIKVVLAKVDANQIRNDRTLNEVARSVQNSIAGLDNLLKQTVLRELLALVQSAKKLEQSQRHIESKVMQIDQLAALTSITANKVNQLDQGIRALNNTQQQQLNGIGQILHKVGTTSWQIDHKLGVLLSSQKNIERALEDCKKSQAPHKNYHAEPQAPHKNYHAEPQPPKSLYDSAYEDTSYEDTSYLHQLWYGKDQ